METKGLKVLNKLARELASLKGKKDEKEGELKKINEKIEILQAQIIDLMISEGNTQFKLEGVGLVYIAIITAPKVVNKNEFFKWLEDNNESYIIKPTIHNKTLKTWYKQIEERYDKEGKDVKKELKGMLEVFEKPQVKLRRE